MKFWTNFNCIKVASAGEMILKLKTRLRVLQYQEYSDLNSYELFKEDPRTLQSILFDHRGSTWWLLFTWIPPTWMTNRGSTRRLISRLTVLIIMTVVQIYDIKTLRDGIHNVTIQVRLSAVLQWLLVEIGGRRRDICTILVCMWQFYTSSLLAAIHMEGCFHSCSEASPILTRVEFRKMKIRNGYGLI
jgi:hypothetical protein